MQAVRLVSRSALFGSPRVSVCARSFTTATQAAAPAKIPITLIQDLRSRTGAGVTDCKKALELNQGDIASAASWLREKGKATATKLSGRVAGEGVIALATHGSNGVIIELNSETDFVARGVSFRSLAHKIVDQSVVLKHIIPNNVIDPIELDTLKKLQVEVEHDEPGHPPVKIPVDEAITRAITKTKENIGVRRAYGITIDNGVVGGYIHGGEGDSKAGRLGALVTLVSDASDRAALTQLASKLAMHVVGLNPKCIDADSSVVAEEYARRTVKNPKYSRAAVAEDLALLSQRYFSGEGETVKEALESAGKQLGAPVRIHSFLRLSVGEGVEKKADNFAEEVMGMVKH